MDLGGHFLLLDQEHPFKLDIPGFVFWMPNRYGTAMSKTTSFDMHVS